MFKQTEASDPPLSEKTEFIIVSAIVAEEDMSISKAVPRHLEMVKSSKLILELALASRMEIAALLSL